jgi:hypothetical protein
MGIIEDREAAHKRALGISEKKRMEVMVALLRHEPLLMVYLRKCGMNEDDLIAMVKGTLRGGEVARHLYRGMVDGLVEGFKTLNTQDQRAMGLLKDWLEDEDA